MPFSQSLLFVTDQASVEGGIQSTASNTAEFISRLQQGHQLVFASNADQLIDITTDQKIDMVIIDNASLGDAAYDIGVWLKTDKDTRDIPLVVFDQEGADYTRWLQLGIQDFLFISLPVDVLILKINALLELRFKTGLLGKIASLDALTSVANHERLDEYLDIEWRRSLREYYPLSLLKLDIDAFTAFNDHYGQGAGDNALKRIARVLESCCQRAGDMVSRYGPDEFAILLPATELDKALVVAERIVASVAALHIENSASPISDLLSLSIGVATIEPSRDKRVQDLFDEVEEVLIRSQQDGGNQAQGVAL